MSDRNPPEWPEDNGSSVFPPRRGRPTPPAGTPGASVFDRPAEPPPGQEPHYRVPAPPDPTEVQSPYPHPPADPYAAPYAYGQPAAPPTMRYPAPPGQGLPRQRRPYDDDGWEDYDHDRRRPPRRRPAYDEPRDDRPPRGGGGGGGLPFGAGTLFGVAGLVAFLLALMVLPWFSAGGQDVGLADIRSSFDVPKTDPDKLLPDAGTGPTSTLPGGLPSPGDVSGQVEKQVRDTAAKAAANAIDSSRARYLELYTRTLWWLAAIGVGLAVLFATVLSPRSTAMSLLLGFRRLSGVVVVLVGLAHGAALWVVFNGTGAPSPAFGVWLGVGGLAAVLLGCILGPKRA